MPNFDWIMDYFGGRNPEKDFFHLSNVIFSTGALDPWRYGCITKEINKQTKVIVIEDGAHCTELAEPDENDPISVKEARI